MEGWSPEQWGIFLGAVGLLIGAIATAAVKIINALHGIKEQNLIQLRQNAEILEKVDEHELKATARAVRRGDM